MRRVQLGEHLWAYGLVRVAATAVVAASLDHRVPRGRLIVHGLARAVHDVVERETVLAVDVAEGRPVHHRRGRRLVYDDDGTAAAARVLEGLVRRRTRGQERTVRCLLVLLNG